MSRKPITISLPEDLVRETNQFCKKHALTVSEMTREALRDYLYKEELEDARKYFTLHAQKIGVSTEMDLLKMIAKD